MSNANCIRSATWHIHCKVVEQEGTCAAGHKVGDEVIFAGDEVKGKICISTLYSMILKIYAMMYNAQFPWLKDQYKATYSCPDEINPLMLELTHIEPND